MAVQGRHLLWSRVTTTEGHIRVARGWTGKCALEQGALCDWLKDLMIGGANPAACS
jgi:hypothetical protein